MSNLTNGARIGYALGDRRDPSTLADGLHAVADAGFTHAEVYPTHWDVTVAGRLHLSELVRWTRILDKYRDRLSFTLHAPGEMNLFDTTDRDLHERLFASTLDLAEAIGAQAIAYHPGVRLKPPIAAAVPMSELMRYEREMLALAGERVSSWGGTIGIETWYTVGEVGYSYAIWPDQLSRQVQEIGHHAVGACIDFGHLFLAGRWFGFDFIEAVQTLSGVTNHLHVQDTVGVLSESENTDLGLGDLHLPLGLGEIPFDDLFQSCTFPRNPVFMVEYAHGRSTSRQKYLDETIAECRRLLQLSPRPDRHSDQS